MLLKPLSRKFLSVIDVWPQLQPWGQVEKEDSLIILQMSLNPQTVLRLYVNLINNLKEKALPALFKKRLICSKVKLRSNKLATLQKKIHGRISALINFLSIFILDWQVLWYLWVLCMSCVNRHVICNLFVIWFWGTIRIMFLQFGSVLLVFRCLFLLKWFLWAGCFMLVFERYENLFMLVI